LCPGFQADGIGWCKHLAAVSQFVDRLARQERESSTDVDPNSIEDSHAAGSVLGNIPLQELRDTIRHDDLGHQGSGGDGGDVVEDSEAAIMDEISRLVEENFNSGLNASGSDSWADLFSNGEAQLDNTSPYMPASSSLSSFSSLTLPTPPTTTFFSHITLPPPPPTSFSRSPLSTNTEERATQQLDQQLDNKHRWNALSSQLRTASMIHTPDLSMVAPHALQQLENALHLVTGAAQMRRPDNHLPSKQSIPPHIKSATETSRTMPSIKRKAPSQFAGDPYAAGERSGKKLKKAHLPSFEAAQAARLSSINKLQPSNPLTRSSTTSHSQQ
jgi:hypothetical protein